MGCYWRYLGPGGVRTDDGAQKRELPVEGRWRGVGVIHAERGFTVKASDGHSFHSLGSGSSNWLLSVRALHHIMIFSYCLVLFFIYSFILL